jgi:hypothetical protein
MTLMRAELYDVAERAIWTFIQAFLAVYVVGDMASTKTAAVAGAAAVLSVIKGYVATKAKPETGAATL